MTIKAASSSQRPHLFPPAGDAAIAALLASAISLYAAGQYREALAALAERLAAGAAEPSLLNVGGACARALGDVAKAGEYWRRAIELNPDYADAHNNLGALLAEQGRWPEAEASYRRALAILPRYAEAHNNLGNLQRDQRLWAAAEASYSQALSMRPDYADALNNLGLVRLAAKRLTESEAAFRQALSLQPGNADACNNLGVVLGEQGRPAEAETAYRRSLSMRPDHAEAGCNLGNLLKAEMRWPAAEAAYRRALAIRPDYVDAQNGLGGLFKEQRRWAEAEAAYRRALAFRADDPEARFGLACLLLALGRLGDAWPLYEARLDPRRKVDVLPPPGLPCPPWRGEDLRGKSLLVWPEQGFGDQIQFARFLAPLKARGAARIDLVCARPLQRLFVSLRGVDAVHCVGEVPDAAAYDYWTYPLSIPCRLGTTLATIPADIPYLGAAAPGIDAWAPRLAAGGLRIGLVWQGRASHVNDRHRSLPSLVVLAPLWALPGLSFFSLQRGAAEDEIAAAGLPITALGSRIEDFADCAAIVSQLDLVICVDTAIAHLAGALGKPCWLLLPRVGTDWRWLEERSDSPWYPRALRLFRQTTAGDWSVPVAAMAMSLQRLGAAS